MSDLAVGGLDARSIVEALNRVLCSATFASAPRSRDLLAFVVTETMDGRGDRLNQRLVSRAALGRPDTVDTRTDAGARVQARRLRDLLDRYYAAEGQHDEIRFSIPVGQYSASIVPRQRAQRLPPEPRSPGRGAPVIAVVQLRSPSTGVARRVAAGLTESIVHALATCPGIAVAGPLAPEPGRSVASPELGARLAAADFVLHGGVVRGEDVLRVTWHLTAVHSSSIVWSESFERNVGEFTGFRAEDEITRRVVVAVGDFSGVVLRSPARDATGHDPIVAGALRSYYVFMDELDPQQRPNVIADLSHALVSEPDNAHVAACLAYVFAIEVLQYGMAATDAMRQAERHARLALAIDSREPTAHNVLGIVALARGDDAAARECARTALTLAPMHTETIYIAGAIIAGTEWERGIELIRQAVNMDPFGPKPRRIWLATDALLRGDAPTALAEASVVHFPGYVYGHVVRAICYHEMGFATLAAAELGQILAIDPGFLDHAKEALGSVPTVPRHVADFLVDNLAAVASV